jgi:hypothetical protein
MSTRRGAADPFVETFKTTQTKLYHSLSFLKDGEFVDLINSKTTHLAQSNGTYPASKDNLFPALKDARLDLTEETVYTVFERSRALRRRKEGESSANISPRFATTKSAEFILDWLTVSMARMHSKHFVDYGVPHTLYVRPRATWPSAESSESSKPGRPAFSTSETFSKMFQWHVMDSRAYLPEQKKILLAIVTSWGSVTTPPTAWGFWTYIELGENPTQSVTMFESREQYEAEMQSVRIQTRLRSFDPSGIYGPSHFTIACEAYNHLTLGQFVALMFSIEFHPSIYSPLVLDNYIARYIRYVVPRNDNGSDNSDAVRTILFGVEPPVNVFLPSSIDLRGDPGTAESPYAPFPTLGIPSMRSPHEMATTPASISFEAESFSEVLMDPSSGGLTVRRIDDSYLREELETLGVILVGESTSTTPTELTRTYPDTRFIIKKRPSVKTARDEALYIKRAYDEVVANAAGNVLPNVIAVAEDTLVLERVGDALRDFAFPGKVTYKEWLLEDENREAFMRDVTAALTALWNQGYIHGDLGTDRPPAKVNRELGDKSGDRNITMTIDTDGEARYHVIDLDQHNMIPKVTSPRYSIHELALVEYSDPAYPRRQAEQIYRILTL